MNFGAFAGGLAGGIVTGTKLHQESERTKRDKEIHELNKENATLDLQKKRGEETTRRAIETAGRDAFQASLGGQHQDVDPTEGLSTVSPKNPFGERGAMVDGAEAMAAAAMKAGRADLAQRHLEGAATLRTQLRSEVVGEAYQRFRTTGDPSALAEVYNRLWPDGGKMDPASFKNERGPKGSVYNIEFVRGEKRFPMKFTEDQLAQHIGMLANPKESFSQDLQMSRARALQQWKWQNDPGAGLKSDEMKEKTRHNQAVEDLKGKEIEAFKDYRSATLSLRDSVSGRKGTLTPKDMNTLIDKGGLGFRKLIESEQSKEDAKINTNAMMSLLPAMQAELGTKVRGGKNPEVAFKTTYYRYKDLVGSLNDSITNALGDANKGWGRDSQVKRLQSNLQKVMEEKGLSREDLVKFAGATKVGSSNALVRQALSSMPKARPVGGSPGLDAVSPQQQPAAAPAAPAGGRPRADQFFN